MSRKELNESLQELRAEIDRLNSVDKSVKQNIDTLATEIEDQLSKLDDTRFIDSLVQNIQKHIEQLETEHPRITGILNRISITLSSLGI